MAYDPSQPPVSSEILLRIGPILIGALLSWMLFGISIVQLYIYHVSFPKDRWAITATVYIVFFLDLLQTIFCGLEAWEILCAGWGRPINLQFPGNSFVILPMISSIIALWVQIFFAWRIHMLGKWITVPIVIIITALAQAGAACAIAISFIWLKDIERLHDTNMFIRTIIWLGGSAFTDITIMTSMLYLLLNVKQKTVAFPRNEFIVNRLIRLTIETGSACAISAVLELSTFLGSPKTNIHFIVALLLCKVYSNTLMTSLNSRAHIGQRSAEHTVASTIAFRNVGTLAETGTGTTSIPFQIKPQNITESDTAASGRTASADDKVGQSWEIEMNNVTHVRRPRDNDGSAEA